MRPRYHATEAIIFAAKTGFLTRSLYYEFFSSGDLRNTQKHWLNLVRRGLFKQHPSPTCSDTLVLCTNSMDISDSQVMAVVPPPHVGQINHDEILAKILLRAKQQRLIQHWISEAELKKVNAADFKLQDRRPAAKYPDALVTLNAPGKPVHVAIELELSRKSFKRYEDVAYAYRRIAGVKAVFFVCKNVEIVEAIKTAFKRARFPSHEKPIGFALVDEWIISPADAGLEMPTRRTTLAALIAEISEKRRQSNLSLSTEV